MTSTRTLTSSPAQSGFPPLPVHGTAEDSDLAEQNFVRRQQASGSWIRRLLPFYWHNKSITPIDRTRREALKKGLAGPLRTIRKGKARAHNVLHGREATFSSVASTQSQTEDLEIKVGSAEEPEDDQKKNEHLFEWAIVYENQRGFWLPSFTLKYSSGLLVDTDPTPYTIATPGFSTINGKLVMGTKDFEHVQPHVDLTDYPLPNGEWRWASKEWMIDTRDGNVQYDGFEYNWAFRKQGWRSKVGFLGYGALVRRRRWVRLMERPPLLQLKENIGPFDPNRPEPVQKSILDATSIWRGDECDWLRVHETMKGLGRDGRKLEVWKKWIGPSSHTLGSRFRHRQWTEDDGFLPSELERDQATQDESEANSAKERPNLEYVAAVLRSHGEDILRLFAFPGTRLDFLNLVKAAGFAPDLLSARSQAEIPLPFVVQAEVKKISSALTDQPRNEELDRESSPSNGDTP